MSSWNSVSLQDQLYLYVGEEGARPSKNLEVFCSGEDFVMMIVITSLPPELTLRRLMSYIYIYIYIYIYMEHPFLMFLDHTQRRSTVGRTPLDE